MTLTNRLQKTQPENLRKVSDHQLENDNAIMTFGKTKGDGDHRGNSYIDIMDKNEGNHFRLIRYDNSDWGISKNGQEAEEIAIDDNHAGKSDPSFEELGINCGPLMQRAVCAVAIQHDRAVRIGESLMTTAMRRANLSVDKNGNISDMKVSSRQNQHN